MAHMKPVRAPAFLGERPRHVITSLTSSSFGEDVGCGGAVPYRPGAAHTDAEVRSHEKGGTDAEGVAPRRTGPADPSHSREREVGGRGRGIPSGQLEAQKCPARVASPSTARPGGGLRAAPPSIARQRFRRPSRQSLGLEGPL